MQTYKVLGIVQVRSDGEWYEQASLQTVRAENRDAAKQAVLDTYSGDIVRWHTPALVRVWEVA